MKTPHSKTGIFIAVFLIVGGATLIIKPVDFVVEHPNMVPRGNTSTRFETPKEHVTPTRSRVYGAGLIILGLALGAFATYSPKRR